MLRSLKSLENCAIGATDGDIGEVKDFYFDDEAWVIRYLIVATGSWLAGRKVLIPPVAIQSSNWNAKLLTAGISKEQVRKSPDIDTDKPVSRQHEIGYLGYYGYPYYWAGTSAWGLGGFPREMVGGGDAALSGDDGNHADPHLRSCNEVSNYRIHASDGDIGHVEGFLIDDQSWAVRYLIVNTSNWWLGHKILVSPEWIDDVSWLNSKITIELNREQVKTAPPYDPSADLERPQEAGLYTHYGRSGYWIPALDSRVIGAGSR